MRRLLSLFGLLVLAAASQGCERAPARAGAPTAAPDASAAISTAPPPMAAPGPPAPPPAPPPLAVTRILRSAVAVEPSARLPLAPGAEVVVDPAATFEVELSARAPDARLVLLDTREDSRRGDGHPRGGERHAPHPRASGPAHARLAIRGPPRRRRRPRAARRRGPGLRAPHAADPCSRKPASARAEEARAEEEAPLTEANGSTSPVSLRGRNDGRGSRDPRRGRTSAPSRRAPRARWAS